MGVYTIVEGRAVLVTDMSTPITSAIGVIVITTHATSIDFFTAFLWEVQLGGAKGYPVQTIIMGQSGNNFSAVFDVGNHKPGFYIVGVRATSFCHIELIYAGFPEDYPSRIVPQPYDYNNTDAPVSYAVVPNIQVNDPQEQIVFVSPFNKEMPLVLFDMEPLTGSNINGTFNGGISFSYDILSGAITSMRLTIYHITNFTQPIPVFLSIDPYEWFFNILSAQANGLYIAELTWEGSGEWAGSSSFLSFSLNNQRPTFSYSSHVYSLNPKGGWSVTENGGTLTGDVKVYVSSILGNVSSIAVAMSGPIYLEYTLERNLMGHFYTVVDTTQLPNGIYDIRIFAFRKGDLAVSYLVTLTMDVTSSGKLPIFIVSLPILLVGVLIVAVIAFKRGPSRSLQEVVKL